ncbi:F-box protein At2g39490-like [Durio zibethinus]|uniref:F-box protein At2g39490-like n=1 Tax=Durio zibethinus TaxID=66656 RepID=A0A6P5YRD4_DURZI|nr:F-box protein At2g39490-like [Durio zibethinus]
MGKKRRIKKNNEKKQRQDPDDNRRKSSRDLNIDDFISTLHNDILHQIIPLLHKSKHQEKEHNPDNITRNTANNMDPNDFFSRLPNDILYHIISLLPFESAVRTTFLSTYWKDLWKGALLTSVRGVTIEDAITAISSFLHDFIVHHIPRNNWGFRFEFGHGIVVLGAIAPNNTLSLDFSAGKQEYARPFDWLLKLNLSSNHPLHTQQPSFNEIKVKSLYLVSVSYPYIEAVSSMVSNFPFLQSLTVAKCNGLRSLQIKEARRLHKLVVLDCPQLESLSFEASSLTSLHYRGRLVPYEFKAPNNYRPLLRLRSGLSALKISLYDAMLDFRQGPPIYNSINCDSLKSILDSIKGVESLTFCRWVFEPLISYMLPSLGRDSGFCLYRLRELWWLDCSMERDNVNALLCFLKLCPGLERIYVTIDPESYNMRSTKKLPAKVNRLEKLEDLELLKLEGFANESKEIFFAKRLRPLFRLRPVILAKSKGACLRRLVKVPELEKEGKYPYKFKEVKNFHETYPDHLHMKL